MLWTYCHLNKGFVSPLNINSCSWPLALGLVFAIVVSTTNTITFVDDCMILCTIVDNNGTVIMVDESERHHDDLWFWLCSGLMPLKVVMIVMVEVLSELWLLMMMMMMMMGDDGRPR